MADSQNDVRLRFQLQVCSSMCRITWQNRAQFKIRINQSLINSKPSLNMSLLVESTLIIFLYAPLFRCEADSFSTHRWQKLQHWWTQGRPGIWTRSLDALIKWKTTHSIPMIYPPLPTAVLMQVLHHHKSHLKNVMTSGSWCTLVTSTDLLW